MLATLDIAQPEIDRINKKIKDIIEGMGDNIGKSVIHSLINVAKAIVSNIPVVGGIVSALSSADELGQEILKFCEPPIVKGAGIVVPIINGINKQIDKIECEGNKLVKKLEPILNIKGGGGISISKAKASIGIGRASISNASIGKAKASIGKSMGGGTRKKLNNSTQRIQYMLQRFGGTRRHKFIMNKRKTRRNLSS